MKDIVRNGAVAIDGGRQMARRGTRMEGQPLEGKKLNLLQSAMILTAAFAVLGWLFVMLIGVRPPQR